MTTAGLVLAAGLSTRFGANNKLVADVDGHPLAGIVANAVREAQLDHLLVVLSDPATEVLFPGFQVVRNPSPALGQASSLCMGVEAAQHLTCDRLLVVLADMPRVSTALLQQVLARATDDLASATTDGIRRMPPACFPVSNFAALTRLEGDRGAGRLINALPETQLVRAAAEDLTDVDTPADLERVRSGQDLKRF